MDHTEQPKLSKNIKALGVVSLLNDASTDMIYPLIPIFLTKVLGASFITVGLIEGIAESTASLLKVFSGWLSDRMHRRKSLTVLGYSLSMISKPILAFAAAPWHVLVMRFSDRFGKGLRQAPRDALIAESTSAHSLGYAYGFHKAMDTVGATIGPLLALLLLPLFANNIRWLFLLSGVASFLALLTLIIFVKEKTKTDGRHETEIKIQKVPRQYIWFLIGIALFSLGNSSDAFLFLRAQHLGIAVGLIPLLYALSNFVFALLATHFGRLSDRIGTDRIMLGGYLIFALTYIGFGAAQSPFFMWFLFPLFGVFSAMTESIQKKIVVQYSESDHKGAMLGAMHMVIGVCQLPASLLAGILWQRVGVSAPFFFGSFMAVAGFIVLYFAFFRKRTRTVGVLQQQL